MINQVFVTNGFACQHEYMPTRTAVMPNPITMDIVDFTPLFPNYANFSCKDLQEEISDLRKALTELKFTQEAERAYQVAIINAENAYNQKCNTIMLNKEEVFEGDEKSPIKTTESKNTENQKISETQNPFLYIGLGLAALFILSNLIKK